MSSPIQGNETLRLAREVRAFSLSQPDVALALTIAITLPILNQRDLVSESTEDPPDWLEDSRAA
jgi:hypothetical protein